MQKHVSSALLSWFRPIFATTTLSGSFSSIETALERGYAQVNPIRRLVLGRTCSTPHIAPTKLSVMEPVSSRPFPISTNHHMPEMGLINKSKLRSRISASVSQRTSPKYRSEGSRRTFWTSRPVLAQYEMSESDLAHIAAQRRTCEGFPL